MKFIHGEGIWVFCFFYRGHFGIKSGLKRSKYLFDDDWLLDLLSQATDRVGHFIYSQHVSINVLVFHHVKRFKLRAIGLKFCLFDLLVTLTYTLQLVLDFFSCLALHDFDELTVHKAAIETILRLGVIVC
ncbi:hypothetical protein MRB53_014004 [Persea americana]|uniref:Uncharacterized protein n=1 Tax=Persea americana TaxID=3435 RepID=A0ACC2KA76_PERAE|nr:hypothetical protein MRB53_014004 [Persea americana]